MAQLFFQLSGWLSHLHLLRGKQKQHRSALERGKTRGDQPTFSAHFFSLFPQSLCLQNEGTASPDLALGPSAALAGSLQSPRRAHPQPRPCSSLKPSWDPQYPAQRQGFSKPFLSRDPTPSHAPALALQQFTPQPMATASLVLCRPLCLFLLLSLSIPHLHLVSTSQHPGGARSPSPSLRLLSPCWGFAE